MEAVDHRGLYIVAKRHFAVDAGGEGKQVGISRERIDFRWAPYDNALAVLSCDDAKTALWELDARLRTGHICQH